MRKNDLLFIRLSITNACLVAILMVVGNKLTHQPIFGTVALDIIVPSGIMLIGAIAFSRSEDAPSGLVFLGKIAVIFFFVGIISSYVILFKDWRSGVYNLSSHKNRIELQ